MTTQRDLFGARIGEYPVPPSARVARCASCQAAIVWTKTEAGRAIPLSVAMVEEREGVRYALTHFADCEHAKEWSGKGRKE